MLIGVCGYTSTGSSAVSDYLKEFDKYSTIDKMEFTITHHPDGLEDLDYHLNEKISKFTSSSTAFLRFRRAMHGLLDRQTRGKIDEITDEFIREIVQSQWYGFASNDFVLYNSVFYRRWVMRIIRSRLFKPFVGALIVKPKRFPMRKQEFAVCPENFEIAAQKFVKKILKVLGADLSKDIVLDQPFSGNDPIRSFKYFEDPMAIIVDRDPRDNYIFAKEVLKDKGLQIPTDTVENFIAYYKNMRKVQIPENGRILKVKFEEMVYEYNKTTEKIKSFLDLDESTHNRTYFVPEHSKNNTCLYKRFPQYSSDVLKIEKALPEYLFDFERYGELLPDNKGTMFYGKSPLNK